MPLLHPRIASPLAQTLGLFLAPDSARRTRGERLNALRLQGIVIGDARREALALSTQGATGEDATVRLAAIDAAHREWQKRLRSAERLPRDD